MNDPKLDREVDRLADSDREFAKECKRKCALCKAQAIESIEFECGNNAENSVDLWLCEEHLQECDIDEYAFRDKYADKIEGEWLENMLSYADSLRD